MKNTVTLPPPLFEGVAAAAARDGMTVEAWLAARVPGLLVEPPPTSVPRRPGERDPLFDDEVLDCDSPPDLSARHDDYRYGPPDPDSGTPGDLGGAGGEAE